MNPANTLRTALIVSIAMAVFGLRFYSNPPSWRIRGSILTLIVQII